MHGGKNRVIALGAKPRLLSEGTPGLLKFSLASSESPRSASGGAVLQVPGDTHHFLQPGWGALSTASFPRRLLLGCTEGPGRGCPASRGHDALSCVRPQANPASLHQERTRGRRTGSHFLDWAPRSCLCAFLPRCKYLRLTNRLSQLHALSFVLLLQRHLGK